MKRIKEKTTPVLKFVGRSAVTRRALEPPASVVSGNETILLPDAETQKRGFSLETVEKTLDLARLFPTLYKLYTVKGEKS